MSGTTAARAVFVSPDSEWIGYHSRGELKRVAASGGAPVTLGAFRLPGGASWGEDDTILLSQWEEGIWRVPASGGTPERVIEVAESARAMDPQMLPGGEWVLFTLQPAGTPSWSAAQIVVQSLVTGQRNVVIEGGRAAHYLPTGHLVYALNGVLYGVAFDVEAGQVVGGPVSLIEGVRTSGNTGVAQFSVAGNGSLVYVPGSAGDADASRGLMWVDAAGQAAPLPVERDQYLGISLSPDGTRAAVGTNAAENRDVWVVDLARGSRTRVTTDAELDHLPLWSPDGESVVFASLREETPALYRKPADGTGVAERLVTIDGAMFIAANGWTPDGTALVATASTSLDQSDIGLVPLTSSGSSSWEPLIQSDAQEFDGAISPDGRWLAYASNETGRNEIYVQRFPELGQRQAISIGGGYGPAWSADGRSLSYILSVGTGPLAIMRVSIESDGTTLTAGQPERLFDRNFYDQPGPHRRYDLSADGRFLMIQLEGDTGTDGSQFDLVFIQNWFQELLERVPVP